MFSLSSFPVSILHFLSSVLGSVVFSRFPSLFVVSFLYILSAIFRFCFPFLFSFCFCYPCCVVEEGFHFLRFLIACVPSCIFLLMLTIFRFRGWVVGKKGCWICTQQKEWRDGHFWGLHGTLLCSLKLYVKLYETRQMLYGLRGLEKGLQAVQGGKRCKNPCHASRGILRPHCAWKSEIVLRCL